MLDPQAKGTTGPSSQPRSFAAFGSDGHLEWIAARQTKNLRFRHQQRTFAALGPEAHRLAARADVKQTANGIGGRAS
jgi:hypothetical protein